MDQVAAQNLLNALAQLSLNAQETTKWYVDGEIAKVNQAITDGLGASTEQLENLRNLHQLFFDAVDGADLNDDGVIDLKATIESLFAKVAANRTLVDTNLGKIDVLESALNSEIADRARPGNDDYVAD